MCISTKNGVTMLHYYQNNNSQIIAIVMVAVYIPPCVNAKDTLRELYSAISEQQTNNPDGFSS